ncbi:MAG: ribonuclease HII [Bacillota bacterium]|nr:ribonuclease HII [Bacillota bacterium]
MTKAERLEKQRLRLEEMKIPERELRQEGYSFIAGVDEVGRGPLAGPVVTAAVVLPEDFSVLGVDDSKKLSEKRRDELYDEILDNCLAYGIGMCDHKVIDEINILQATKKAMREAIDNCNVMLETKNQAKDHSEEATIDFVIIDAVELPDLEVPQMAVTKGDAKVLAIAAASIVAKVTRDRMMVEFAKDYPYYAFEKNKGYGTAAHYDGIREHGICDIHRKTFLKNIL